MAFIVPENKRAVQPGQVFGRLTVEGLPFYLYRAGNPGRLKRVQHVVCSCVCGRPNKIYMVTFISRLRTFSCGCVKPSKRTHGESRTALFRRWTMMKSRCYCKTAANYHRYGGRGIFVCDEWRHSYAAFRDWSARHGYRPELDIDRIDNDGPYSPENCRWVSRSTNLGNRRNTVRLTAFGETKTLADWFSDYRCAVQVAGTLYRRVTRLGWDHERALVTPSNNRPAKDGLGDESKQNDCDGIADV